MSQTQAVLLYPFDLGLELDFAGADQTRLLIEHDVSTRVMPALSLGKDLFSDARAEFHFYRFGVGMIQITFPLDFNLGQCAQISYNAEKIAVGEIGVTEWCEARAQELIERAQPYAIHRYDKRLKEPDIFPVFIFPRALVESADLFIRENYKALYGIVAGERDFDLLSDFVFQREPLANLGYYENELIVLKRFGAVFSSAEQETILNLITLAYAQYWSLKSYHFFLDSEMDSAKKLLEEIPPYFKFWQIPSRYQEFSKDAIDFSKDKISIVDSLYNVSANLPQIEKDWHLRTLYKDMSKVFNIDDLYKTLEIKLNRVEESYNQAREFLSTNFFILLDFIFFLWLVWGVFDTFLLLHIAKK